MEITRDIFVAATGRWPEQDDLVRCNCKMAGRMMHINCGWDEARNLPKFETFGLDKISVGEQK